MYKIKAGLFFNLLTPMHVGGSYELSIVDQPIQREGHTGFPKIEASSLKGSLRHTLFSKTKDKSRIDDLFGSEKADEGSASPIVFSDARLLFFPVRSVKGVFAFVTCPMILQRFFNDMNLIEVNYNEFDFSQLPIVAPSSEIIVDSATKSVVLEEYTFSESVESQLFEQLLKKISGILELDGKPDEMFIKRAIVISDDAFADFVQFSTEIVTRIRINHEKGIVEDGALFNEEYLPAESIMYSLLFIANGYKQAEKEVEKAIDIFKELETHLPTVFQIGGNATLGKGFVECRLIGGGSDDSITQ